MKVVIDHDHCSHGGFFSERCLEATIRSPLGHERSCMAAIEDDGSELLTIVLIQDGSEHTIVLHNKSEQEAAAFDALTGVFAAPVKAD